MGDIDGGYSKEGGTFVVRKGGVVDSGISGGSSYAEGDGLGSKRGGNGGLNRRGCCCPSSFVVNEDEPSDSSGEGLIRSSVVDGKLSFCSMSLDFGSVVI